MVGQVVGQVVGQIVGQVVEQVAGQVVGKVEGQVEGQVAGQVVGQLAGQVVGQVGRQVVGQVVGQVGTLSEEASQLILNYEQSIPRDPGWKGSESELRSWLSYPDIQAVQPHRSMMQVDRV